MRAAFPIIKHYTKVHYGDWHAFAVCRTCGWEGPRSYVDSNRTPHGANATIHALQALRSQRKANRWHRRLFAKPTTPVVHHVGRYVGQKTLCCGITAEQTPVWDDTSSDASKVTCGILEAGE